MNIAKQFYSEALGLELADAVGGTAIHLPGGAQASIVLADMREKGLILIL